MKEGGSNGFYQRPLIGPAIASRCRLDPASWSFLAPPLPFGARLRSAIDPTTIISLPLAIARHPIRNERPRYFCHENDCNLE